MFNQIFKLWIYLNNEQKKELLSLQILVICISITEMASVFSIGPFMALVADKNIIETNEFFNQLYIGTNASSPEMFLFWCGSFVLAALTVSSILSMFVIWRLNFYGQMLGVQISSRIYRYYLQQSWSYHSNTSSSSLINNIGVECGRLTNQIIIQLLNLNARFFQAFVMSLAIIIFNPVIATIGIIIFITSYFSLYSLIKIKLDSNGKIISKSNSERMKVMQEGFGGIKDVLLLGRQSDFIKRFKFYTESFGIALAKNNVFSQVPRYGMELIGFGSIIALILALLIFSNGSLTEMLPVLSIFALAGVKLLPSFQQIYFSITQIRGNISALESLDNDLSRSQKEIGISKVKNENLTLNKNIKINNLSFKYPGKHDHALQNINIEIPKNTSVGIVGFSGSGKSTLFDVAMGLLEPNSGSITVDGKKIDSKNLRSWQNAIGYVAQDIFLSDSSIEENIAFGVPKEDINKDKVKLASEMSNLTTFMKRLPEGFDTVVGERGVQLSGGQKQRIGIARALYNDAQILFFDEATSALDGITESKVVDAIKTISSTKTILIIAHRLSTIKFCDVIYVMHEGKIVDSGSFEYLSKNNQLFQDMSINQS